MERIKGYFKKLLGILKKPEMAILPSNIAFNIILSIIPLLTIVVLSASYFDISIDLLSNLVSKIMPKQVSDIIIDVISGKGFDKSIGLFNFIAFLIASNGTYAIINTSNTLYKIIRLLQSNNNLNIIDISEFIYLFITKHFNFQLFVRHDAQECLGKILEDINFEFNESNPEALNFFMRLIVLLLV